MKNKSLYMRKILLKDLINSNVDPKTYYVAIPDNESAAKTFKAIWKGSFKAFISHIRITGKHKNFFRKLKVCVDNGVLDHIVSKGIVSQDTIDALQFQHKKDTEVLRYIMKWLFLPLTPVLKPDGSISYIVSSQAFDELDELYADELFQKVYSYLADIFNVSIQEFNGW